MSPGVAFPRGVVWQEIRAAALDTVPDKYPLTPASMHSLSGWLKAGSFQCQSEAKYELNLLVYSSDIGGALLGDAEYFLNHATEHRIASFSAVEKGRLPSDTWLLVTYYYWAYFSALAITRMTGKSTWFLDGNHLNLLRGTLSGGGTGGAGTYVLDLEPPQNSTQRVLRLKRSKDRLHEAVWDRLFRSLDIWVTAANARGARTLEARMYEALLRTSARHGRDWPSALRNVVNYRPGMAYDAVAGSRRLRMMSATSSSPSSRIDVVSAHESALQEVGSKIDPSTNGLACARLLISLCYVLDDLATTLHDELLDRLTLARSWSKLRKSYVAEYMPIGSGWPLD
ncbi:MAG: hypothetical protein R3B06_12460 [Kofleriaceae bacterium]